MKTIIVVTHGRSGSTLLMGLLNAIPGYCIRGENNNAILQLQKFSVRLMQAKRKHGLGADTPTHAWYGIDAVSRPALLSGINRLMLDHVLMPPPGCAATGYKEIRFGERDVPDLAVHMAFLREVFPGVRFVFNVRNVSDTSRSGWWKEDPAAAEYLTEFQDRMRRAFDMHRDASIWLRYEEVIDGSLDAIHRLFGFLGDTVGDEAVRAVLNTRHSVRPQADDE